jgi:hypothetical protein
MRGDGLAITLLVAAAIWGAMCWHVCPPSAHALDDPQRSTSRRLQMLVAENGWRDVPDHAATLHALRRLAKRSGRTELEAAELHISEFRHGWRKGRGWIANLSTACTEPEGWPGPGEWGEMQRECLRLVAMVRAFDAGKLASPCKGEPDQWRSRRFPKLQRAAVKRGWRRVGCGRTLHVFWETRR